MGRTDPAPMNWQRVHRRFREGPTASSIEAALVDAEGRGYRLLFERNPHPMWVYDRHTLRFLTVNHRALESYGYTREDFLSMTIEDIVPAEERELLHARISEQAAETCEQVGRHVKKSGEVIDVEIRSDEIEIAGAPARLVAATDITARLEARSVRRSPRIA